MITAVKDKTLSSDSKPNNVSTTTILTMYLLLLRWLYIIPLHLDEKDVTVLI